MPNIPNDYVPLIQQSIAVFATVGAVLIGAIITWLTRLNARLRRMETRDRLSWLYIRSLIDYAYKHSDTVKHPLPEPPPGLLDPDKE